MTKSLETKLIELANENRTKLDSCSLLKACRDKFRRNDNPSPTVSVSFKIITVIESTFQALTVHFSVVNNRLDRGLDKSLPQANNSIFL